jgi:hypothetical protein
MKWAQDDENTGFESDGQETARFPLSLKFFPSFQVEIHLAEYSQGLEIDHTHSEEARQQNQTVAPAKPQ